MERSRQILRRVLFPGLAMVIISIPIAAALLIYTFVFGQENSLTTYLSYVFSAYSLTIFCAWMVKNAGKAKEEIQLAIHKNKFAHRYLTDISFKMQVSLYLSFGINMLYAAMKLFYGFYYRSIWFGTLAVYYIMLAVMRFLLLHHSNRNAFGKNLVSELKQYRLCGVILMLMNTALSGLRRRQLSWLRR